MVADGLNVLMLSLSNDILTQPLGDSRERHIEYAERLASLHMLIYTSAEIPRTPQRLSSRLIAYPSGSRSPYTFVWDALRVGAAICRAGPIDVITTQDPFSTGLVGALLKHRFGIPLDVQNHSDFVDNRIWMAERWPRNALLNALGKWIARQADTLRVLNAEEKAKYLRLGLPDGRVWILPTPVRLARFAAPPDQAAVDALRRKLDIALGAPILLWVGKPVPFKHIPDLIHALDLVREAHPGVVLVLVGDFGVAPNVLALVERLGLGGNVRFAGRVPHQELPRYYHLCDIYVHPSIYEGLGKVMIEAAASSRPVVGTRTAGACEIVIDGETGLLSPPGDVNALAANLIALLGDPTRAAEMGRAARAYVTGKFERERAIERMIEMWRTAAGKIQPCAR
jgi:glycosyltransferase involved in cell wall biosynthesis